MLVVLKGLTLSIPETPYGIQGTDNPFFNKKKKKKKYNNLPLTKQLHFLTEMPEA